MNLVRYSCMSVGWHSVLCWSICRGSTENDSSSSSEVLDLRAHLAEGLGQLRVAIDVYGERKEKMKSDMEELQRLEQTFVDLVGRGAGANDICGTAYMLAGHFSVCNSLVEQVHDSGDIFKTAMVSMHGLEAKLYVSNVDKTAAGLSLLDEVGETTKSLQLDSQEYEREIMKCLEESADLRVRVADILSRLYNTKLDGLCEGFVHAEHQIPLIDWEKVNLRRNASEERRLYDMETVKFTAMTNEESTLASEDENVWRDRGTLSSELEYLSQNLSVGGNEYEREISVDTEVDLLKVSGFVSSMVEEGKMYALEEKRVIDLAEVAAMQVRSLMESIRRHDENNIGLETVLVTVLEELEKYTGAARLYHSEAQSALKSAGVNVRAVREALTAGVHDAGHAAAKSVADLETTARNLRKGPGSNVSRMAELADAAKQARKLLQTQRNARNNMTPNNHILNMQVQKAAEIQPFTY